MSATSNPRPKRGGEEFSRSHNQSDVSSPKKIRFDTRNPAALAPDVPEEDEVLDADEIGKRGQQTKRNAVNIDGYQSDSSNEGFDARAGAKVQQAKTSKNGAESKDEEENDMFAELEDDFADKGECQNVGRKKKSVKFLEIGDIEGQVQHSKSGGHVSGNLKGEPSGATNGDVESSTDSEVGDEQRAEMDSDMDEELGAGSKRKHAPKLEAFNLSAENEEGVFDEHGNYVRKAQDPDAVYDTWMEGLSKKDLKKARQAQVERENERRQQRLEMDSVTTGEALKALIPHLDKGETILEALARLGRKSGRKVPKWKAKSSNRHNNGTDGDSEMGNGDSESENRRKTIEAITWAADILMSRDHPEIYDTDRELLTRMYRHETGEDWVDNTAEALEQNDIQWEYRWSDARDGGETHGPFDGSAMRAWNDAGYFEGDIEFRRASDLMFIIECPVEFSLGSETPSPLMLAYNVAHDLQTAHITPDY